MENLIQLDLSTSSTWARCVNAAIRRTVGEAIQRSAWQNLLGYCAANGCALPENSEERMHEILAGKSLVVTFAEDGFVVEDVLSDDPDSDPAADA